jgi:hypothetical protein
VKSGKLKGIGKRKRKEMRKYEKKTIGNDQRKLENLSKCVGTETKDVRGGGGLRSVLWYLIV